MPNQREIARVLGISQVAVSLALRGDRSVSEALRQRVTATAEKLGYRSNPYVRTLMSQIRAGRKPPDQGTIALIVDSFREKEWRQHPSYRIYVQGVTRRSAELGFHLEYFFLMEPGMSAARIDRILNAQGIQGLILAPPYRGARRLAMTWSRYACVGTGYAWEHQPFDRVAHDHDENVVLAFQKLSELGYARIGLSIPARYHGRGTRWLDGLLTCQYRVPEECRIPLFIDRGEEDSRGSFRDWLTTWRPEVLLTLYGDEIRWLAEMNLAVPRDIGVACLIRPPGSTYAGINDRYDLIGEATVELVASKIALNQYGIPAVSKLLLIEGYWINGSSVRKKGRKRVPSS